MDINVRSAEDALDWVELFMGVGYVGELDFTLENNSHTTESSLLDLADTSQSPVGTDGWVKDEGGWTWSEDITSLEQARAEGYDDYSDPGKIITTASGEKVRLGEGGVIHVGVVGIHSNVDSDADLTGGHAWLSVSSVEGNIKNTYSLWPDNHPLFEGGDPKGEISDVRVNIELDNGYAESDANHGYYVYITKSEANALNDFITDYDEWGYLHTCADWSRDSFRVATGIKMDVDDIFGIETPRELSQSIEEKGANTPQTPLINERNRNRSSFNNR